jgi:hypothetical protein
MVNAKSRSTLVFHGKRIVVSVEELKLPHCDAFVLELETSKKI